MKTIISAIVLTLAAGHSISAPAKKLPVQPELQEIELKGIKLGMGFNAVADAINNAGGALTIGGVGMKGGVRPNAEYDDSDRMTSLYFSFTPDQFDDVIGAVKSKYPATKCSDSQIQTRMGASFTQTECRLSSVTGLMSIVRYSGSIDTGSLMLVSRSAIKEQSEKSKKKESDI